MNENVYLLPNNDTLEYFKLIKSSNEMMKNPILVEQQQYLSFIKLYRKGLIPNPVISNLFATKEDFGHILKQIFSGLNYYDTNLLTAFERITHHYLRQYDCTMLDKGYQELYDLITKLRPEYKKQKVSKTTNRNILFQLHLAGFAFAIEHNNYKHLNYKLTQLDRSIIFAAILLKPLNRYEWENLIQQSTYTKSDMNFILNVLYGGEHDYRTLLEKRKSLETLEHKYQSNIQYYRNFLSTYYLMIMFDIHYINTRFVKHTSNLDATEKFNIYFTHSFSVIEPAQIQVGT